MHACFPCRTLPRCYTLLTHIPQASLRGSCSTIIWKVSWRESHHHALYLEQPPLRTWTSWFAASPVRILQIRDPSPCLIVNLIPGAGWVNLQPSLFGLFLVCGFRKASAFPLYSASHTVTAPSHHRSWELLQSMHFLPASKSKCKQPSGMIWARMSKKLDQCWCPFSVSLLKCVKTSFRFLPASGQLVIAISKHYCRSLQRVRFSTMVCLHSKYACSHGLTIRVLWLAYNPWLIMVFYFTIVSSDFP